MVAGRFGLLLAGRNLRGLSDRPEPPKSLVRARPECHACLERLVLQAAAAAAPADSLLRERAECAGLALLREGFRADISVPPRLATEFQRVVRRICGAFDPFLGLKDEEFAAGLRAASRLAPRPEGGLEALLRHAVLGNQLDFFRALDEVEALWGRAVPELSADEVVGFSEAVAESRSVLVLADNAGEVPFDLPLLWALEARGLRVRYAVKGGPSQNDATRADVARFGLDLPGLLDTGTDAVGCELSQAGSALREAWDEADLVLAKGMANYETLTEYPEALEGKPVFFLLCAKCAPVAESLGVPVGAAVLVRGRPVLR